MNRHIDLVARTSGIQPFRKLLGSLENQISAGAGVGVVAVLAGVDEVAAKKFASLAEHRTDLVVAGDSSDWWSAAAAASSAEFLLPVADGEVLTSAAVDQLLAAAASGADVVVARAATPGATSNWDLFASSGARDEDLLREASGGLPVLVRRSVAVASSPAGTPSGDVTDLRRTIVGASTPTILAGHPVLRRPKAEAAQDDGEPPESLWATGRWADGAVHLSVTPGGENQVRYVTLRHLSSGVDWLLESHQVSSGLSARVAPCAVADGEPLARGRWVVDAHLVTGEVRPVAWKQSPGSALLSGLLVTAAEGKGHRVVLDVGATRRSPLAGLQTSGAVIEESARGTRLQWPLPFAHVLGDGSWSAGLALGGFPVTARLRSSGGTAYLEAWLSGLRSRVPVSMELAGSPAHATGFDLEIGSTGQMALLPHEGATGSESGGDRAASRGGWRSLVRRVRSGSTRSA